MSNPNLFDRKLSEIFKNLRNNSGRNILKKIFYYKLIRQQKNSYKKRKFWRTMGIPVPPLLITSITHQCNLKCSGCYASTANHKQRKELSMEQWDYIYKQAIQLGVSIFMIAGGEPLIKPEILDVLKKHKRGVFIIFTNGLLMSPEIQTKIKQTKNILPVLSLDGMKGLHDSRRGKGTFDQIIGQMKNLKKSSLRFGVSITVTKNNFSQVTGEEYIQLLIQSGIQIFFFIEFVPKDRKSKSLILSSDQQHSLEIMMKKLQERFKMPFITFPGNEEQYGGCLAAGRGFVHIGTDGSLEPCPFAPFSDINITRAPLKDALKSNFLNEIRKNHNMLTETQGGCALWSNREWVQSLLVANRDEY